MDASFWRNLFSGTGFPPRWSCGSWDAFTGWLHISADVLIFAAYMAIPLICWRYHHILKLPAARWTAAFFVGCGFSHLHSAIIFWHPFYRWAALWKAATAIVSVVAGAQILYSLRKNTREDRKREAVLEAMFDKSTIGAAVVRPDFYFENCNNAFCSLVG